MPLTRYCSLFLQINGLSGRYPGLMSLRSVDLSPASWMAVAWSLSISLLFFHKQRHTGQAKFITKEKKEQKFYAKLEQL